jgi:NAD+ synthase (glutamine-hydrolysing)
MLGVIHGCQAMTSDFEELRRIVTFMALRVAGAQLNLTVGDIPGNEEKIAIAMDSAERAGADILLVPELAIAGYPPEDLVLRRDFVEANLEALGRLAQRSKRTTTVVGFVDFATGRSTGADDAEPRSVANGAAVIRDGANLGIYHKVLLPNYGVFDEDRYFVEGTDPGRVWEIDGVAVGVSVCEDIWRADGPPARQAANGARVLLNINASPFHRGKAEAREEMLAARARSGNASVVYLNLVGGQDELVFDGASAVIGPDGRLLHRSPQFEEDFFVVEVPVGEERMSPGEVAPLLEPTEEIYRALTTGLADYCRKNGFRGVVVQLSGGIDSAVATTIAVDALGPESVWALGMPSRFSSQHSVDDARALAENLGIRFDVVAIDDIYQAHLDTLSGLFEGTEFGVAEENLQARTRGTVAMAVSNKFGPMVLATGNKSEMAVGYATLYGDMVGGYAVLKDVFKGVVYELARWRNKDGEVIPQNTIDKPPSAELRPGQRDSDSLPPYDVLDPILERYIENDMGVAEIVAEGYDAHTVLEVARLVDRNEYKRRQSAPGVKITTKAFGKDRRLPITNHYRPIVP